MVPGNVVLEEVANFEQWHPAFGVGCFALHALFMQLVSRQAAPTALPWAGKKCMRRRQQFYKCNHCCLYGLQEKCWSKILIKLQKTTKYITLPWSFPINISNWAPNRPCKRVFLLVILTSFSTSPSRPAAIESESECSWSMVIWQRKTQAPPWIKSWICGWCLRFLQSSASYPYGEATENSPSE